MNELILIVEDEEDIAQVMRYNLQKAGYRTVVASDGEQALRTVRCGEPDLVLLDLMLPEMDGWEVCRVLRGSEQAAETPVVIVTAAATEEARVSSLRVGADDFITKPFSMHALLLRIRKILDLRRTVRTLQQRHRDRETALRHLVHELKNSLSVIGGYSSLATARPDSDPFLQHIASTAEHMDRMLTDVSLLARLEDGNEGLVTETVELVPLVYEVVESFRPDAEVRGISLLVMSGATAPVSGNRVAIRQVLSNLLSNAIKFNRLQGSVWVSFNTGEDWIDISVKDEGAGIPPEHAGRVFEKFYRCPGTQSVKGSGLGLYVVRLLMESMGGTVRVASDGCSGTTFTASFVRPDHREPATAQSPTHSVSTVGTPAPDPGAKGGSRAAPERSAS